MIFFSMKDHFLETNPLLKPLLVCGWPQLVSFVHEALELSSRHLVRLAIKLRLEFGGHPAYPPPSRIDPLAQYHPQWGLGFAYEWGRGRLAHPLDDLWRKRGLALAAMAGLGPAVGSSRRGVVLLGPRWAAAPGPPTGF